MNNELRKIVEQRLKNAKANALAVGTETVTGKMFTSKAELLESILDEYVALPIHGVMQEFNSLILRLVELLSVKYPNRKINNEFIDNLKTVWKGNELGLKANIEALEKELNFA